MTNQLEELINRAKHIVENGGLLARDTSLALIAALEQAQQKAAVYDMLREDYGLDEKGIGLADLVDGQADEISNLKCIKAAAEKLVRCKGRYHSEQNYRALAALFGVITPDLPPLDGEASKLAVKPFAWVSVKTELPDPKSKWRVCAYTPSEHSDLMYRSLPASLFKAVCSDATHWCYFNSPDTVQGEE